MYILQTQHRRLYSLYEDRSEITDSYFIMLAHDVRDGCW